MTKTPAIFFGHGSPMNAIENNECTKAWQEIATRFPPPKAILVISAHWFIDGVFVTDNLQQKTIHDFYGFPQKLFDVKYDAIGDLNLAKKICKILPEAKLNSSWGLDHGAWQLLVHLYPKVNIPVIQLSIDRNKDLKWHYELAKKLRVLRDENILIIGSGNIVHNLAMLNWNDDKDYDFAIEFNNEIKKQLLKNDHEKIIDYKKFPSANLAVPTIEHFAPLIYILALQEKDEEISIFNDRIELGSIAMMSVAIGLPENY